MTTSLRTIPILLAAICPQTVAQAQSKAPRIHEMLESLGEDVRTYDSHVTTLANPFLQGRLPGTRGMEIAKEYVEYWLRRAGAEPAFEVDGTASWRQTFLLGQKSTIIKSAALTAGDVQLTDGKDFVLTGLGAAAGVDLDAELVFCGYGIQGGKDAYTSFPEDTDLKGKIALVLRFEPMDEQGKSKWSTRGWSASAGLQQKLEACNKRGAAAILLVNTAGADDPRTKQLYEPGGGGSRAASVPVFQLTPDAAARFVDAASGGSESLAAWTAKANAGTAMGSLGKAHVEADLVRERLPGENVGGVVRGRGGLASEWVVLGAHLDHLGYGSFGSRRGAGQLHPGADDNASGTAGMLMIADAYRRWASLLPQDVPLRNVLFIAFSGEESGLVGSRHYVKEPIAPLDKHALMINFDMIGRMKDERLSVSGTRSAAGMEEWLDPILEASDLTIVVNALGFGGSDHQAFLAKRVPYLFSIIADFHDDYHTPDDVSWKIDREGAVKAVHLYTKIVEAAAMRSEPFVWQARQPRRTKPDGDADSSAPTASRASMKVRFGIKPGNYEDDADGVQVDGVTPDTPAEKGGVQEGDRIISWNGEKVGDIRDWMTKLMKHDPGDKVKVGVLRKGKIVELVVELEAPNTGR
ncbi:MAG: M28 family peptidase [Planctomycetes bacterium]|nr:M28 family peptidase [Planctomycetota bacterium]